MRDDTFTHYQPKMDMDPIREVLGENHPEITGNDGWPTALGRYRLISALRNLHGENYRNIPKAARALDHYDSEYEYAKKLRKLNKISPNSGPIGGGGYA